MAQNKLDWPNLLFNIHQSYRHEQSLRAQEYSTGLLSSQLQEATAQAEQMQARMTELNSKVAWIGRALLEREKEASTLAKKAQEQASLRDIIFQIRKTVESLRKPSSGDEQATITVCEKLRKMTPSPSEFEQIVDKEYCHETIELIERTSEESERRLNELILAAFRRSVESIVELPRGDAQIALSRCLETQRTAPPESTFEDEVQRSEYRQVAEHLVQKAKESRQSMTTEQCAAVDALAAVIKEFFDRCFPQLQGLYGSKEYHAEILSGGKIVESLHAQLKEFPVSFRDSMTWLPLVTDWEDKVLKPHLVNLFQLKCMILVAKADGQLKSEEREALANIGSSLGLGAEEAEKLIQETVSVRSSEFKGDSRDARTIIQSLIDVAAADGRIEPKERSFIYKVARSLKVSDDRLDDLYITSRKGFLQRQLASLLPDLNKCIMEVLSEYRKKTGGAHVFVTPAIPENKLRNATAKYGIPVDERVLGLVDFTVLGSATTGLALGQDGIYWHDKSSGQGSLRYNEFERTSFVGRYATLSIGAGRPLACGAIASTTVAALLCDVGRSIRKVRYGEKDKWYVAKDLEIEGPLSETCIERRVTGGEIVKARALVWRTGLWRWLTIKEMKDPEAFKLPSHEVGFPVPPEQARSAQEKAAKHYRIPRTLTLEISDEASIELGLIPAGEFQMGCDDGPGGHASPKHLVRISQPFYMAKCAITQGQWHAVMHNNPTRAQGDPSLPVDSVPWEDCQEFCRQLSSRIGRTARLPTEAQWEHACRAGNEQDYSFGNSEQDLAEYAWYRGNSDLKTHAVAKKRPNAFGLFDMHGNVLEWCFDWFATYQVGVQVDPQGPPMGSSHVLRGGCYGSESYACSSWFRFDPENLDVSRLAFETEVSLADLSPHCIGFRIVSPLPFYSL